MKDLITVILRNLPGISKLIKGSWFTTLLGYLSIAASWLYAGGTVIVWTADWLGGEPSSVSPEELQKSIEILGIGHILGFIGIDSRSKEVSSEEQKEADGKPEG